MRLGQNFNIAYCDFSDAYCDTVVAFAKTLADMFLQQNFASEWSYTRPSP